MKNEKTNTLVIIQKKTKALNAVPICSTAAAWMPEQRDDKVFHLPAHTNVDAALKRIAKKVGIEKKISFHPSSHSKIFNPIKINLLGSLQLVTANG